MTVPFCHGATARTWDEVHLAGELFPGIATLSGPGIKRKIDVKNPKGASGASLTDEGDELGRIDIDLFLWEEAQWTRLQELLPLVHPRRKGGPKSPIAISHPLANVLGLENIYIDQIPIFDHDKRQGTVKVSFKAIEWVPAPKPQQKAAGSKGANGRDGVESEFGRVATPEEELAALAEAPRNVAGDIAANVASPENVQANN